MMEFRAFIAWVTGKLSMDETGVMLGVGSKSFARRIAWCWKVEPRLPACGRQRYVQVDGKYLCRTAGVCWSRPAMTDGRSHGSGAQERRRRPACSCSDNYNGRVCWCATAGGELLKLVRELSKVQAIDGATA